MPNLADIHAANAHAACTVRVSAPPLVLAPFNLPPPPLWLRTAAYVAVYAACSLLVWASWQ